jgi:hypothetical protein
MTVDTGHRQSPDWRGRSAMRTAFETHLVGKSPEAARQMLGLPETRERIADTLADFAAFATDPDAFAKG